MWKDPIFEELDRIRKSMRAENGNDLAALARASNARATKQNSVAPLTPPEPETRTKLTPTST
jgi:hypothetical protein